MDNTEFLNALAGLIGIESVARVDTAPDAPFGTGPAKALDYMLKLCEGYGFRVKNCDNRVGWAEIGQGDEMIGILCHLDVVPAGEDWDYPPYALTIDGDRAYGRGMTDDKGPSICCVAAMKDLLDAGTPLKRRIRVIFGQCEEGGQWDDMAYYRENEEMPVMGFTPDSEYPAIYGEKGIFRMELHMPLAKSGLVSIEGGDAQNVVPSHACAVYVGADGREVTVRAEGKSAHASTPELGLNAIAVLMEELAGVPGFKSPLVAFFEDHIGYDCNGGKMGCDLEDEQSGRLTMNAGLIGVKGDDIVLTLDVRIPVTYSYEDVLEPVSEASAPYGITVKPTQFNPPTYSDKNGPLITTLMDVYRELTGDYAHDALVVGGGTYARSMKNNVAFGPMLPGRELTEHMGNEYALLEDLELNRNIYCTAMERLANL